MYCSVCSVFGFELKTGSSPDPGSKILSMIAAVGKNVTRSTVCLSIYLSVRLFAGVSQSSSPSLSTASRTRGEHFRSRLRLLVASRPIH